MSAQIEDGGVAFPASGRVVKHNPITGETVWEPITSGGMTLRDWFAGQAIMSATMMENQSRKEPTYKGIATRAYMLADAMLAARKGGER